MPQHTFSREQTLRTPRLKIKLSPRHSQSSRTRILIASLTSLLDVKFTPFPSLLSSPSASSSRAPTSLPGRTRSWCQSPDAPARWRESGRLVDSGPNTGYEPNLANSSSCTHPEHTAIDIPHRHQDFWCSDVVTMMSTSAEGIQNSEALSSSCKAAISKVSSLLGHSSLQKLAEGNWRRVGQRICCNNDF